MEAKHTEDDDEEQTLEAYAAFERFEKVFEEVSPDFEFGSLIAELQATRLAANQDASRARDAYVQHLRAWTDYVAALRFATPTRAELATGSAFHTGRPNRCRTCAVRSGVSWP